MARNRTSIVITTPEACVRSVAAGFSEWWPLIVWRTLIAPQSSGSSIKAPCIVFILNGSRQMKLCGVARPEMSGTERSPGSSFGRKTILWFIHEGRANETDHFTLGNTTWGALMYRLKAAAEGNSPGPLFSTSGMNA